jgi:hypothetical protein
MVPAQARFVIPFGRREPMKASFAAAICLVVAAPALAGELALPITLTEPVGVARKAEPVCGGIPLPADTYKPGQAFALYDGARQVPLQVAPLVVDARGFLRWILLDFQTDLAAKETKTFTLKTLGADVKALPPMAREEGNVVTVDTGRITLSIDKTKPFTLFSSVKAGKETVTNGGSVTYTDDFDGKTYTAGKPSSIEIEYNGPMRTTVAVKGRFVGDDRTKLQYIARITAWDGKSAVHVKYSLANTNPDHYCYRRIKDSTVALKLAAAPEDTLVGGAKPLETGAEAWMHQSMRVVPAAIHSHDSLGGARWLRQTPGAREPGGCKVSSGGKDVWTSQGKGDVSEGWIAARLADAVLWATDLYFVEDPPRRLAVRDGSLILTGVTVPLEGTKWPFGTKQRWLFDCSHLSSQYVLDFAASADTAELTAQAKRGRHRLWAMAPPAWYFETEALPVGEFGTQADELKCYETWGWKYDPAKAPKGPAGQTARIERWTAADDNHFTSEQDTVDGLLLMYLRTGRRSFFDACQSWVHYFMDLQTWRTDGWRWKDGGGWWHGGPAGNRPQRAADPVTGVRNRLPAEWTKSFNAKPEKWDRATCKMISVLFLAKACHCHNWGEGLAEWFLLTGDRDAYEAAIDTVEQNYDTHHRAFRKTPGKASGFSRDFTRSSYLTHATRMIAPADPYVIEASDYFARVYLERPNKEPRGLVNGPGRVRRGLSEKTLERYVGKQGIEAMKRRGIQVDPKTGQLTDPKTGAKWFPLVNPHTWMFPPLSRAMSTYYRVTGNEDALDWTIAYGQAVARVLYQPKHGNLSYGRMLVDFPVKGVAKDWASWVLPEDSKNGEGVPINGYLGQFYPDVPARAYSLCGVPLLKQRAYDYWYASSHRGYNAKKMHNVGGVGRWVNLYSTHNECVCFTGRTFYIWAHPREDTTPPAAVTDLAVRVEGDKATVSFTAPADAGGRVARYQVKCSDKPIVDYEAFLDKYAAYQSKTVTNWWMAANLSGEPDPKAAGARESFTLTGVPEGAKYFAVRSFDAASNRSALGAVAEGK